MTYDDILSELLSSPTDSIWTNGKVIFVETSSSAEALAELLNVVFDDMRFIWWFWPEDKNLWDEELEALSEGSDDCVNWYGVWGRKRCSSTPT